MYDWNFLTLTRYADTWLLGIAYTVGLGATVVTLGTGIGGILLLGRRSSLWPLRWLSIGFIDLFRAIPAFVLIGTLYFCLPIALGVQISALSTAVLALSVNLAPFAAECMRAGIESVPTAQYESCRLLGFSHWQRTYLIIGPQALKRILPGLLGQWITSLKLTSLAATIGVPEIWHVTGQVVTDTSLPLEARLVGALLYALVILPCVWFVEWIERNFRVHGLGQPSRV